MKIIILFVLIAMIAAVTQSTNIHFDPRIVNGIPISATQYPWMVSLRQEIYALKEEIYIDLYPNISSTTSYCGGSLIQLSPPAILTAAHCLTRFRSINGSSRTITQEEELFGSLHLIDMEGELYVDINRTYPEHNVTGDIFKTIQIMDLSQVYIHKQFNELGWWENDIALIIFKDYTDTIFDTTVVLPTIPSQLAPSEPCCTVNDMFKAIGYGQNETKGQSTFSLHETSKPFRLVPLIDCVWAGFEHQNVSHLINKTQWEAELITNPHYDQICALSNDTDICYGDSGGPLLRENDEVEIVGISSLGFNGCNSGHPSVFTSVAHFTGWIMKTIVFAVYDITMEPTSTAKPSITPSLSVGQCDEAIEEIKVRKNERDTWVIIAIVFICLFGITCIIFIVLICKVCNEKKYTPTPNPTERKMGRAGSTRLVDI